MLTLLAVMLPGPWTPVVLLIYAIARLADNQNRTAADIPEPWPRPLNTDSNPDPYAYRGR